MVMTRKHFITGLTDMALTQMLFADALPRGAAQSCEMEESKEYLSTQILTYLGNKRSLLHFLGEGVEECVSC